MHMTRVEEFQEDVHNELTGAIDVSQALRVSAKLVEECAFEIAGSRESVLSAQLIVMAAELERLSRILASPE